MVGEAITCQRVWERGVRTGITQGACKQYTCLGPSPVVSESLGNGFGDTPVLDEGKEAPQDGSPNERRYGVQGADLEQWRAMGRKGPGWGPAVKPLLIPELGNEIRKAGLWEDGRGWQGLAGGMALALGSRGGQRTW